MSVSESILTTEKVSVACQTDPNLIDKLIDNHIRKQLDDVDLYQDYVRSAECAQFWPLDKNPIRSLVPSMLKVDLPEQHLKNESLMFDLVQAITNSTKLVNLLAKYIHHIVPNVIISKRIDLIPLITCTIRVCNDTNEQERLISLLFNLIKRPNEEQRRMMLSGIIVVLQVSPHQNTSLLLPNLWDHVNDKFPERRILLAELCATLAHYVRPIMRTNLILSILIQLLKDKNAAVRCAACKSFSCLLSLIMDRNDEVFDACLSATEDVFQDMLQQTPISFCEHRYELEQMRFCILETIFPLIAMWSVKLNRFKVEVAEFYLIKAENYFVNTNSNHAAAVVKRRTAFFKSRHSSSLSVSSCSSATTGVANTFGISSLSSASSSNSSSSSPAGIGLASLMRRQSAFVGSPPPIASSVNIGGGVGGGDATGGSSSVTNNTGLPTAQRAISAYLKVLNYLVPFVFSDAVHSCAWLTKSKLHLPQADNTVSDQDDTTSGPAGEEHKAQANLTTATPMGETPIKFNNKLLEPTLLADESAIVAFHDQLKQEHMADSVDWILSKFLVRFLNVLANLAQKNFYQTAADNSTDILHEYLFTIIASVRQLCLLFGKYLTRTKLRPLIKQYIIDNNVPSLFFVYIASLSSFEPIEQQEFEEMVLSIRQNLLMSELTRNDVEMLAVSIKILATSSELVRSPSTRQKFLTYILDALVNYSNQTKAKEFMLIIFRHILTCLIDPSVRPIDWAHILVTKFLPLLILLANDSTDVYVCTHARLMCAQLVDTFDNYLSCPKLTQQMASSIMPALNSLKGLTEQIRASNLKRQIECLTKNISERFFSSDQVSDENNNSNNIPAAPITQ